MASAATAKKVVVIGGSGLIGAKVVKTLREQGHSVVAASPRTGVNSVTGAGLSEALAGAAVVIDVSNSPSFADGPVMEFFDKSTRNIIEAARASGVRHLLALSVVGTDGLASGSGYFRAKKVQQDLIKASGLPYTIVQATQFFEFLDEIIRAGASGDTVRLPPAPIQPIVSDDVAAAVAELAMGSPLNATVELAGPEVFQLDEMARKVLAHKKDPRTVVTDPHSRYYGIELGGERSIVPSSNNARLAKTRLDEWLAQKR